jgi:hypothetical protein
MKINTMIARSINSLSENNKKRINPKLRELARAYEEAKKSIPFTGLGSTLSHLELEIKFWISLKTILEEVNKNG